MPEATSQRLTRKALIEAIWLEPMRILAPRLGVSDVSLAKTCRRAGIPVPERGFWAKRRAGAREVVPKLPPRPLGIPEEVFIGRGNPSYWEDRLTQREILEPIPPPFDEACVSLRSIRARVSFRSAPSSATSSTTSEFGVVR
jgi:hypothetical protein